jgi:hypothetical protein
MTRMNADKKNFVFAWLRLFLYRFGGENVTLLPSASRGIISIEQEKNKEFALTAVF